MTQNPVERLNVGFVRRHSPSCTHMYTTYTRLEFANVHDLTYVPHVYESTTRVFSGSFSTSTSTPMASLVSLRCHVYFSSSIVYEPWWVVITAGRAVGVVARHGTAATTTTTTTTVATTTMAVTIAVTVDVCIHTSLVPVRTRRGTTRSPRSIGMRERSRNVRSLRHARRQRRRWRTRKRWPWTWRRCRRD